MGWGTPIDTQINKLIFEVLCGCHQSIKLNDTKTKGIQ